MYCAPLAARRVNCDLAALQHVDAAVGEHLHDLGIQHVLNRMDVLLERVDIPTFLDSQRALAVEEGWDVDTLEEHIHAIEHVLYPEVVQMLADGRVHVLESGKVAIDAPRG